MSNPPDQYPKLERKYPTASRLAGRFGADFEAIVDRLAPSRATVFLVGGTSDERCSVALALHERSGRSLFPFVVFDCSGLSSDDVEERLFGGPAYVPARGGAIREADAGTLYVAAVDELPLLTQPRFLRFLDQERPARVVASAAGDLLVVVERGHFRLDLAERLTLVELELPDSGLSR
jgi:DNA-binding NtrC family response regulator